MYPGVYFKTRANVFLNLGPQGATTNGELHSNGDDAVGHGDVTGHSQVDNVVAKFGVDDGAQEITDLVFGGRLGDSLAHVLQCRGGGEKALGAPSMRAPGSIYWRFP